jgi:hypothetical protein
MTNEEKRKIKIHALGEITMAGFDIVQKHDWGEPMLLGGYEYVARRGEYILAYNIKDSNICLQKNDEDFIDWNGDFVIKWKSLKHIDDLGDEIRIAIGIDFYKQKD